MSTLIAEDYARSVLVVCSHGPFIVALILTYVLTWLLGRRRVRVQLASATLLGNSLRQTVHTHCASVHQAAKLVAALLRVARVWRKVMAAYRRVYDSSHMQADCQETGSAPEP